jgi:hypothetical protein
MHAHTPSGGRPFFSVRIPGRTVFWYKRDGLKASLFERFIMSDYSGNSGANFRDRIRLYKDNRSRFLREQLIPYVGRWVAFSSDGSQIVASSEDLADLEANLRAKGTDPQEVLFEQICDDKNSIGADFS